MIFYFTGTGNSRAVAEQIGAATQEKVISVTNALRTQRFHYAIKPDETLGFVVPTYYWGLPTVVLEFLAKLTVSGAKGAYTYLVLTCGGSTGKAGTMFEKLLKKKGQPLSAQFAVASVDNFVPMFKIDPPEKIEETLAAAEKATGEIIEAVLARTEGDQNTRKGRAAALFTEIAYPLYLGGRKTAKFAVDPEKCVACGLCERICPCRAIVLEGNAPRWDKKTCALCLGCLHRCPTGAIEYGKSQGRGKYTNPRVRW